MGDPDTPTKNGKPDEKKKLVCPNCGSDRRYERNPKPKGDANIKPLSKFKGHAARTKYICAKCGMKYNSSGMPIADGRHNKCGNKKRFRFMW